MQICVNEETHMFTNTVPNVFLVEQIAWNLVLTSICLVNSGKSRQKSAVPNDFFHLKVFGAALVNM